jgi:hypothetical protein
MSAQSLGGLLALVFAIVAANAPFLSERLFLVARRPRPKSAWLRLLELAVYYGLSLGFAFAVEQRFGPVYPQGWEFYGITACLFVVLAYPGFVWRYLRRPLRPAEPAADDPVRSDRDGALGRPEQPRA